MSNDLFDYEAGLDELLAETTEQDANAANTSTQKSPTNDAGLGLDEEIKVTRKRAPIAKLDENKLLSQAGIPKLRRKAKEKLKYKGKGHEFSYAAKLLTLYQLWLDDLYPRAKFADALSIVEKLGHSKRMQVMRKEWINEDKPKPARTETYEDETGMNAAEGETAPPGDSGTRMDLDPAPEDSAGGEGQRDTAPPNAGAITSIFGDGTRTAPRNSNPILDDDDEDLFVPDSKAGTKPPNPAPDSAAPDEDDLDTLLAETEQNDSTTNSRLGPSSLPSRPANNDDYDDDLEAMNMYGM